LQDLPKITQIGIFGKITQIGIFGLKIYHLATLLLALIFLNRSTDKPRQYFRAKRSSGAVAQWRHIHIRNTIVSVQTLLSGNFLHRVLNKINVTEISCLGGLEKWSSLQPPDQMIVGSSPTWVISVYTLQCRCF
jgi:hypothetical protein